MKNKKGFTIVELVIVIAVIAILAAVLIPTFTTVTANARASAALSTAKNAQTAVLNNSEGSMPENTLIAVNNDKDADAEYAFIIKDRKIESVKLDTIKEGSTYPVADEGVYTVFITADYFDSTKGTDALKAKVAGLVQDILDRRFAASDSNISAGSLVASTAIAAGTDYAVWTYKKNGNTSETVDATINVYYNADIPDTCAVFFANN